MSVTVMGMWIRGKGGAALITAIVFVFFLTLFGLAFYRLGETDIDLFTHQKNLSKSLYASEAGFDKVRWMLREIPAVNPFSNDYDAAAEANAISIANPTSDDFFPDETGKPYFRVSMIQDVSDLDPTETQSKVRARVLGSVDADDDGVGGLTDSDADGFTFDPDDVNRKFEAFISLPGSLSENVSAAATAFSGESGPSPDGRLFVTPDGDSMNGFLYFGNPPSPWGIWDRWEFIFSNPVITGDVELPPGIFDETTGEFIDEDNDTIPDYFQHLDLRTYSGIQTFTPANDPTAGADGRAVIYVNDNIIIDRVDFGYLNDQGEVKDSDWEKTDLTFIANGDITVTGVDCGNVGRLVLVAKDDIIFKGDYDTKVNGIAIASDDITLDGDLLDGSSSCQDGLLTPQNPSDYDRPVRYAAYFLGSMVAGDLIRLEDDGWAVIYDENVINGNMYSTVQPKPTLTYERAEAEDFDSSNNWASNDSPPVILHKQGTYIQDEIATMQGDYNDPGVDDLPELMRVYTNRTIWKPKGPQAIEDRLRLDFTNGDFDDPDIPDFSLQNWDYYDTIAFWMVLDNFKRTSTDGTKTTRREAKYVIRLRDSGGNTISVPLDTTVYPDTEWGTVRYHHTGAPEEYMNEIRDLTAGEKANGEAYSGWKRVKISLNDIDPAVNFDFTNVEDFDIRYVDMTVSWTVDPAKPDARVIWYDNRYFRYYDENGNWRSIDNKDNEGDLNNDPPAPNDGYNYLYDDAVVPFYWIRWIEDPDSASDVRMREEVLMPTVRVDRLELPGKPAANDYHQYGFPHSLRLEITNWREF
jgi:hypothetical protein